MGVLGQVLAVGTVVLIGFGGALLVFLIGMRRHWPVVMGPVVALSRRFLNPSQMRSAGTPGAFASIVQNRGRTSGREYETPVGIVDYGDGFVISLPYGTTANWMRNVLAAEEATIIHEGKTIAVNAPRLVPIGEVDGAFTTGERRTHAIFGIDHALRLERVDAIAPAPHSGRGTAPLVAAI